MTQPHRDRYLFTVFGLRVSAMPSAGVGVAALAALTLTLTWGGLGLPPLTAVLVTLAGLVMHWSSEFLHNLGHAFFARRVGWPMTGIRFWGVLATSVYPPHEPDLPASVHIARALGGPFASALVSAAYLGVYYLLPPGLWRDCALFASLWNAAVFTLQIFIPLRLGGLVNDGGTLWYWWPKR